MLTENLMTYRELKHKAKEQLKTGTNRRDLMLAYLLPSLLQAAASIVAYLAILAVIQSFGVEKNTDRSKWLSSVLYAKRQQHRDTQYHSKSGEYHAGARG